jgi:hypothetical protein
MPEIGTSGSMSEDGKRGVAKWPKLPRLSSTLPERRFAATQRHVCSWSTSRNGTDIVNVGCNLVRPRLSAAARAAAPAAWRCLRQRAGPAPLARRSQCFIEGA